MEIAGRLCRAGDTAVIRSCRLPAGYGSNEKYTLFRITGTGIARADCAHGEPLSREGLAALMLGHPVFSFRK